MHSSSREIVVRVPSAPLGPRVIAHMRIRYTSSSISSDSSFCLSA